MERCAEMGVALEPAAAGALIALLDLLAVEPQNLTAIEGLDEGLDRHLADSLSALAVPEIAAAGGLVDIGSGAGFPGLPLAIVNPGRHFMLLDSTAKKTRFIRHAADKLKLTNVEVVNERAENYKPAQRFDCVVSRALSSLHDFIRYAGHLCSRDGRLLAMKGQYPQAEIDALPKEWRVLAVHRLQVPGLDAERHIVELQCTRSS
jgi:16S rRNA (guanine527-N7)-methyltransferase